MTTEELVLSEKIIQEIPETSTATGSRTEMVVIEKLKGFDFWQKALKSAKYVVAPMVSCHCKIFKLISF